MHRRFGSSFTDALLSNLASSLAPQNRVALSALPSEQREKEESARVVRQRPVLRVYAELALVGIVNDGPNRSGGETIMKILKELVRNDSIRKCLDVADTGGCQLSHDPTLASLPLLATFLKSYARPFLGIAPSQGTKQQASASEDTGEMSVASENAADLDSIPEDDELVEKDTRDKFKRMCNAYYDSVVKKLIKEHDVSRTSYSVIHAESEQVRLLSGSKSKTVVITKRTSSPERSLRIASKHTRR